jgi:hypothetical protein
VAFFNPVTLLAVPGEHSTHDDIILPRLLLLLLLSELMIP